MSSRLLIGLLGSRNSGKSHTWNELFGEIVRTGKYPRKLQLLSGECVEVFLVSGSFEERGKYAGDILGSQDCRIVLCSLQYTEKVRETLSYLIDQDFHLYIQWLNPGYSDAARIGDELGIVDEILREESTLTIRDGRLDAHDRVHEIRQFIYGWGKFRGLITSCER
ncbi:MAG: hypothetical protein OXH87_06505 [Rhodospirillaceae bacterium]|nr:hypothetical protein [Rhodospirillaceae bacterium]